MTQAEHMVGASIGAGALPCDDPDPEVVPGPRPSSDVVEEVARLTTHQRRLFDLLAARPAGLTVGELADLLGSHENTVRGHLETLEARHLVGSTTRLPRGRGRPSRVYQARAATPHLPGESLAGLIRTLMSTLAPEGDDGAARALGRVWALDLMAEGRFDVHTVDPLRELETLFARMGCAPQACSGGEQELRHCPFMEPGTLGRPLDTHRRTHLPTHRERAPRSARDEALRSSVNKAVTPCAFRLPLVVVLSD